MAISKPIDFTIDANLAGNRLNEMNKVGKTIVNKYGSGQAKGIDDYYHSLLHCELGQKGHKENSQALGSLRELYDYIKKVNIQGKDEKEVLRDAAKDLTSNEEGYKIGEENKYIDCRVLLNNKRTKRMKDENIW